MKLKLNSLKKQLFNELSHWCEKKYLHYFYITEDNKTWSITEERIARKKED